MSDVNDLEKPANRTETSESGELTPEELLAKEKAEQNAEISPEEVSHIVEEAVVEVEELKRDGQEWQEKIGDPEAADEFKQLAETADATLGELTLELPLNQEENEMPAAPEAEPVGREAYIKSVNTFRGLIDKYKASIEAGDEVVLEKEEQSIAQKAEDSILAYAKENPADALRSAAEGSASPDIFAKDVLLKKVFDAVGAEHPLNSIEEFARLIRENTAWQESDIRGEVDEMKSRAESIRIDYINGQIESALQNGDVITAIKEYGTIPDNNFERNRNKDKLKLKIRDEIDKLDLNGAIKFYRQIPAEYDTRSADVELIIFKKAVEDFEKSNDVNKPDFIKKRNQYILENLKNAPDVALYAACGNFYNETSGNWSDDDRQMLFDSVLESGGRQDLLANIYLSDLPDENREKDKPVLFEIYLKDRDVQILYQMKEFYDLFTALPEDRQKEIVTSWINKDDQGIFTQKFRKNPELFNLDNEQKKALLKKIIKSEPHQLESITTMFGEDTFLDTLQNIRAGRDHELIGVVTRFANMEIYKKILSPQSYAVLEKSVSRFQEPFAGGEKDRIRPLLNDLVERNQNFLATDSDMEIFAAYLDKFGVQPTPKLYEYFANIQKLKRQEIAKLPEEQIDSGLDTIEKISARFQAMREKVIAGELPSSKEMGAFDYDVLAVESNFYTSRFARPQKMLSEMHARFEKSVETGDIKPLPPEYEPVELSVEKVKVSETSLENCAEEYGRYRADIIAAEKLLHEGGLEEMGKEIMEKLGSEIDAMSSGDSEVNEARAQAQNKRRELLNQGRTDIASINSIDALLKAVLKMENNLGIKKETSYTTPYLRRTLFAKTISEFSGYANLDETMAQSEVPTLEGVHFIRDIISNALKEHVLSDKEAGDYFSKDFALTSKELSKLRKIFPSEKIQQALGSIEGSLEGKKEKIMMMPDRSFTGELAGYYSDACYTRVDNMLQEWPNVIPCKFVRSREDTGDKELIGAVVLIESVSADNKPVLIVRANNPRDKYLDNMQAESFCSEVERAAAGYAKKRGIEQVLIATASGTQSNRDKIIAHINDEKNSGAATVKLRDSLKFNGYEIQNDCILAAEVK